MFVSKLRFPASAVAKNSLFIWQMTMWPSSSSFSLLVLRFPALSFQAWRHGVGRKKVQANARNMFVLTENRFTFIVRENEK